MNEELRLLMQVLGDPSVEGETFTSGVDIPAPEEIELTPEIRRNTPVINNARGGRRLTGVSDFFANPEVQNALLQFGRAFAQNQPGEPGTILANAGERFLSRTANREALEAAESGQGIAEAGGTFADPQLVASLQANRQEMELARRSLGLSEREFAQRVQEFDAQTDFRQKQLDLREKGIEQDAALKWAGLTFDERTFNQQYQLREREVELREQANEIDTEYRRALIEQIQSETAGEGVPQDFLIRTERFLGVLGEQELNLTEQLNTLRDIRGRISDVPEDPSFDPLGVGTRIQQFRRGRQEGDLAEQGREALAEQGIATDAETRAQVLQEIDTQIERTTERIGEIRSNQELLSSLTVEGLTGGTGGQSGTARQETSTALGSVNNPRPVSSLQGLRDADAGYYTLNGQMYEVADDGTVYTVEVD